MFIRTDMGHLTIRLFLGVEIRGLSLQWEQRVEEYHYLTWSLHDLFAYTKTNFRTPVSTDTKFKPTTSRWTRKATYLEEDIQKIRSRKFSKSSDEDKFFIYLPSDDV